MKNKNLHIISFDVPYPDNYGGVIDVFHKIRHLHQAGVKITLHCFTYGRERSSELEKLCEKVYYYPRHTGKLKLFNSLPYIVISRTHPELIKNLRKDDAPILFEGLHTTYLLSEPDIRKRKTIVRTHNIEHEYYNHLAQLEQHPFKKIYYTTESKKLLRYEPLLKHAGRIAAISNDDFHYFQNQYGNTILTPAFHAFDEVSSLTGRGDFCLYHGNLSIAENHEAALWLMEEVLPHLHQQIIIAGQHPRKELRQKAARYPQIKLISNPDHLEMDRLIQQAHVHLLPAFQNSGIKLKLLHALYRGRFVIANAMMTGGSGLESICVLAETPADFANAIHSVFETTFGLEQISFRKKLLEEKFSNATGAAQIVQLLDSDW